MTVHSQLFFYKEGRPFQEILRVFQTLWMTGLRWKLLICVNFVHSNDIAFLLCSFYTITLLITLVFPWFSKGNVFYHPHTILSPSTFLSLFYFLFFYLRLLWYVILDILPFFNRRVGGYLPSWFSASLWMIGLLFIPSFRPSETRGEIP